MIIFILCVDMEFSSFFCLST